MPFVVQTAFSNVEQIRSDEEAEGIFLMINSLKHGAKIKLCQG
jgi:hypothetical protein